MEKINIPESFRFVSDLEQYKRTVDYTKTLLDEKQLIITYGCIRDKMVKLLISKEEFEERFTGIDWKSYNKILRSEILYILEQNYVQPIKIEKSLEKYLREEGLEEEEVNKVCQIKLEKRKYAYEKLYSENDKSRYRLKKNTISDKLSAIKFDICKTVEDESVLYAHIKFQTDDSLVDAEVPAQIAGLISSKKSQEISFICDKYDLDYIISELTKIQKRL